jgi:hypothetical protein
MAAQFTADLNPKSNAISLGDMMKMGLYSAETEIANRKAQIAAEQQKEMPLIQSVMADPENKLSDGSYDTKKLTQILPAIAPLTGPEYATKIVNMTKNHIDASKAVNDLSQQERGIIGSVYAAHAAAGTQDPNMVIASLNNLRVENPNLNRLVDLKIDALKQIQGGPEFNKKLYQARNETLTPTQVIDQFAPKAGTATVGNALYGTVTQPSILGEQPTVSTSPLGGGQGTVTPTAPPQTKELPKLIQEDTSMSYSGPANPLNLNKYQEESYAAGKKNISDANTSKPILANMQESVRKVEDYINSAAGSKLGQMVRQGTKFVLSDPELDKTVKNLANLQARSSAIMGLNSTDSSRELNAKLSGSVDIAPEALAGVMQQVKAETKAAEQYIAGVNKFVEKRGDVNGYIQAQKFQNKWAEHYDPRIFQVDDIASSKLPENEKVAQIGQITGRMTKPEFEKYKEDRQIINRLSKGLYQ